MKKFYVAVLFLILSQLTIAQNYGLEWVKQMGSTSRDEGHSITTDVDGNVYTTGCFGGTIDFDPGTGTFNLTSAGGWDIFIQKLDSAGNLLWAKQMGGTTHDYGHSITTDAGGNVYTTGYFQGTADFDPGAGIVNLTSTYSSMDIFIQKLDTAGNFLWAKKMGWTSYDGGYSITTDVGGNVYTTGYFRGTADFDPGAGTTILTSAGLDDIFIQKLDTAGNFLWAKQIGGTSFDVGTSITTDNSGNIYTTGYFKDTVDFDPGAGITNLTSVGLDDIFIQKLNSAGNLLWVKQMGGTSTDYGWSITTDADGNVYTTGWFMGTADFDPGAGIANLTSVGCEDVFIQKLDSAGNFLWAKQMGGTSWDEGRSITTDAVGNVYTTGWFSGTADFDPGAGTANLTSDGSWDIFIQKLDTAGNLLWAKKVGGTSNDYGQSITTDASGNVYTTGYFCGTADFDPGVGTANLTSVGDSDIYIQKLDTAGNLLWVKQMGGTYEDCGHSITTDIGGNVYSTGSFMGTVDFDPGAGTNNLTAKGLSDIFIQKLDVTGSFLWVKQMGGISWDGGNSITTDASGNVYTTGGFNGTVDFDPGAGTTNLTSIGGPDIFIQKLDYAGNLLWAKQMGGISNDGAYSITTDTGSNVYTIGSFQGIADFDPGTGTTYLTSTGGYDIFIQKLNSTGNLLWVKQIGGTSYDWGYSITTDAGANVYTTGCFQGTADFDPGAGIANLTSAGHFDIFIQKLSQCIPTTGTETVSACDNYFWPTDSNTYISSGIYNDTLTNAAGCDSVVTLNLTIITIDNTVSKNGVTLSANEVGANYQWLDCNNSYSVISGASNQSFTATSNGNYAVEITKNSCVDTSNCYSITNIGIIENSFGDKLVFYPNPTSGIVNLEFGSNFKNVQIIIRNSQGKLVKQQEFKKEQNISIEIEGSKGIYLIEVISADKKAIIKVVKQ